MVVKFNDYMGVNWLKQRDAKKRKNKEKTKRARKRRHYFYRSREWLTLRYEALIKYERKCMCCRGTGIQLHVDHIKPIYKYPDLKLDINNLQVLCARCNIGKGAKHEHDLRPKV